jgi:hypothetical protein
LEGEADVATLNVGVDAFNCRAKVWETPPPTAVSVIGWAVETEETVVMNPTLVALAGTNTVAGTVAAAPLLDRLTVIPPDGAAAFSVTVQASVPEPVIEALVQENALKSAPPASLYM